ncbi:MAG: hypothetical protein VKP63_11695 [Cyanobacteriota bacterium]|nr:hypothetical protein [Cyanobacteriota bacterium]
MATGQSLPNALPNDVPPPPPSARPLRLVSIGEEAVPPAAAAPLASPSPALRRLQRDLAAAHAEARSLRELLEELPAILERKFQQRLQALLLEQRQLEQDNALLQHHLLALASGGEAALAPALPPAVESAPQPEAAPITMGLGLRRALRSLHR